MRSLYAIAVASSLALSLGCRLIESGSKDPGKGNTPIASVTASQLVNYLNEQASRLQTISAEVKFTAKEGLIPISLHGDLTASQPRFFRMKGSGTLAGTVDMGSNSDQFWMYLETPKSEPTCVYASHLDFESGRAKLPGGLPFEPDWVMQALGMHVFPQPKDLQYGEPRVNQSERTYTLSWQTKTPAGVAIKKEVVFEADASLSDRPHVKKHLIRDSKDKLLCSAEIKKVSTAMMASRDPRSSVPVPVQYPTHIVLKWEVQKYELDLVLERVQVNGNLDEQARRMFVRPDYSARTYDLAKSELTIR